MKSLQELLEMQVESEDMFEKKIQVSPDFRIAVQEFDKEKGVRIIIHANEHHSNTLDFWVKGNNLTLIDNE